MIDATVKCGFSVTLIQPPEMNGIAPHRAIGYVADRPASIEGWESARRANAIHGLRSQASGEAGRALGEDPDGSKPALGEVRARPQVQLMSPSQGSNFRKVERLTPDPDENRVRKPSSHSGPTWVPHIQNEGATHDVYENKGAELFLWEQPTMYMKTQALIFAIPRCS